MSSLKQNKLTMIVKRFLDLSWFLFLFLAVAWPIVVLGVGLSISPDPGQRHTDINVFSSFQINSEISPELAQSSAGTNTLLLSGRGDLKVENTRSRMSWFLSGAMSQLMLFIFLFGLRALRRLFTSLALGDSFSEDNAANLRTVGYVVIGSNIISPLLQYFGSRIILQDIALDVPGISLYPAFEFSLGGVFVGLVILVLAGVLSEAVRIHDDQALTI